MNADKMARGYIVLWGIFLILAVVGCNNGRWTRKQIDSELPAPIPDDAANLTFIGTPRSGQLVLSFQAPSESAAKFASYFCEGELISGYNPFEAINIGEPFTFAHPMLIEAAWTHLYYSYSPDATNHQYGNQCMVEHSNQSYMILVDKTDPQSYVVSVEVDWSCALCFDVDRESVRPIENLDIEFLGLTANGNEYILTGEEMCFGVVHYRDVRPINGADVRVDIDGESAASANVNYESKLVDRRDSSGESITAEASGNDFYYCFAPDVSEGEHTASVFVFGREQGSFVFIK